MRLDEQLKEKYRYEHPNRKSSSGGGGYHRYHHHPSQKLVSPEEPPGMTATASSSSSYSAANDGKSRRWNGAANDGKARRWAGGEKVLSVAAARDDDHFHDDIRKKKTRAAAPPPSRTPVNAVEPPPPPFASGGRRSAGATSAAYVAGGSKASKVVTGARGATNGGMVTEEGYGDGGLEFEPSSSDNVQIQPGAFAVRGANAAVGRSRDDAYDELEVVQIPDPGTPTVTATATLVSDVDVVKAVPIKDDTSCCCCRRPCDRRTRILVAVLVPVLVASVALLVGFLVPWSELLSTDDDGGGNPRPPPPPPPPGPGPGPSRLEVMEGLVASLSSDGHTLPDPSSPQGKALSYVVNDDGPDAPPVDDTERLLQRYALATLYHSTGGDKWVDRCNFLLFAHECDWRSFSSSKDLGVRCDTRRRIISIRLPNNRLYGTVPPEIGLLKSLARLDLHGDVEYGMSTINVNTNSLESSIPTEIGSLSALTYLDLSRNVLNGTVPSEIAQLDNLVELRLFHNRLGGQIPPDIKDMPKLELLSLAYNRLVGTVVGFNVRCQYLMENLNLTCTWARRRMMRGGDGDDGDGDGRDLAVWGSVDGCSHGATCCDPNNDGY